MSAPSFTFTIPTYGPMTLMEITKDAEKALRKYEKMIHDIQSDTGLRHDTELLMLLKTRHAGLLRQIAHYLQCGAEQDCEDIEHLMYYRTKRLRVY